MAANANLYSRFEDCFTKNAAMPAFVLSSGTTITYGELIERVASMANALTALGVKPGDRVMAQIEKSFGNVELYLASLKVGAVFNPLNTAYTPAELEYFITDAAPALVVVGQAKRDRIGEIAKAAGVPHVHTLEADETGTLATLAAEQKRVAPTAARDSQDMAALLYTSGTTGRSKGAMITHENLSSNAETLHAYWGFVPGDVLIHALPIFHVHGLFVALNTAFLNGSKILWMQKFDTSEFMARMNEATVMMGVPTFYTRLLGAPDFGRNQVTKMRLAISGSAPLLAETHHAFEERTGLKILERYGMTEAGMITSNPYRDGERLAGTVGYALPGISVRVTTPEGVVLPSGEVGVLEVKGPNVFKGYWKNPEKTAEEFRKDGYFITGDVSTIGPDGRVTIVGRAKDLIISGGFNVYPKEIETEIDALTGVAESAVVGVPHADFGEGVIAVLTAKSGQTPPDEAAVLAALKDRLAKFKLPKRVFVVDELPRNAMGKVQKNELRKHYGDIFKS